MPTPPAGPLQLASAFWDKKIFPWIQRRTLECRSVARAIRPCGLNLILGLGIPFLFLAVEQAAEGLRCMAENEFDFGLLHSWQRVGFFIALAIFSLHAWYFNRVLLYFHFKDSPRLTPRIRKLRAILPRLAGILPCVVMAFALWKASAAYDFARPSGPRPGGGASPQQQTLQGPPAQQQQPDARPQRRPRPPRIDPRPQDVGRPGLKYLAALCLVLAGALYIFFIRRRQWLLRKNPNSLDTQTEAAPNLATATKIAVLATTGCSLLLFILFTAYPVGPAQLLGTASILFLAGAAWISFGSWLVYLSRRFQVPLLMTTILILVASSAVNDNHHIRSFDFAHNVPLTDPKTHFTNWCANLQRLEPQTKRHPVFIVAAEGGGIRAAYWTATVLGEINRHDRRFASHCFAISGVSGGSLGATVFTSLLANQNRYPKRTSQEILSHDFLAPTVAYMLYPDLTQRFLPCSFPSLCRAKALEMAWEDGWTRVMTNEFFAQPFETIWKTRSNAPSLFLNGTCVETGHRIIASNLDPTGFNNCLDASRKMKNAYRISTAVDMSARFTYVSPAGRFHDGDHIVDGGYFENSGAATAGDIWKTISGGASEVKIGDQTFFPVYIIIDSKGESPQSAPLLAEVMTPIQTLLNTRVARAKYSQDALPREACHYFTLDLDQAPLPLGWQLSRAATQEMNAQVRALDGSVRNVMDRLRDN